MSLKKTSRKPVTFLSVTKSVGTAGSLDPGNTVYINILDVDVDGSNYGIRMVGNIPGICPPYEEHSARKASGYKIPEWRGLDPMDRAMEVAHFRIDKKAEMIASEAAKDQK